MLLSHHVATGLLRSVRHSVRRCQPCCLLLHTVMHVLCPLVTPSVAGTCWAANGSACDELEKADCLASSSCSWCTSGAVGNSCFLHVQSNPPKLDLQDQTLALMACCVAQSDAHKLPPGVFSCSSGQAVSQA